MPRRNRRDHGRPVDAGAAAGWARAESGRDGEWLVRSVPGSHATKVYRCPGCDHEIAIGVAHVVAWPADETGSVADRRHWHRACWQARARRHPTRRR
ncbi:hypothetical protein [Amycolatopsis alkalitolerans]|uniref:ATP/GTP-binding protein n=1 Tax=Amycolatopsis alkalitolerans TaxID=2547244 RepID=A0A5C4LNV9_9PSEU|nr:hypothetical protein [Amycolatopsis alkalitolerans]TNC18698.1 hypothetical protein FG385_33545 [Amycolatopsis alkalitolerans]